MLTQENLISKARAIDGRGYPNYKNLKGSYDFDGFILEITHVQSDPFASPSSITIEVPHPGFLKKDYEHKYEQTALEDFLIREFRRVLKENENKKSGSGKSGKISVSHPGQEILERSACHINPKNGSLTFRFHAGFPAAGRKILGREFLNMIQKSIVPTVRQALFYDSWSRKTKEQLETRMNLVRDQDYIRKELENRGLSAFIADGAILPRASGISSRPMEGALPFVSPDSLQVTMDLPYGGKITGMGVPNGITLIVGGGYHGKTTLLEAIESGVYPHIEKDGREYVITREDAFKIRAEDGRGIHHDDISMFIQDLPFGKSTSDFVSEDASGSTSQAANVAEALEAGSRLLLMDEDTSATNFMIRDQMMADVVETSSEPIIPFVSRIRDLKDQQNVSVILAAGSSGAYFDKADTIIQMDQYVPVDITALAREKIKKYPKPEEDYPPYTPGVPRFLKGAPAASAEKVKVKSNGLDTVTIAREPIDVRYLEQLKDPEQLKALGQLGLYAVRNLADQGLTLSEVLDQIDQGLDENTLAFYGKGDLARPRRYELAGLLNRWRSARFEQKRNEGLQPEITIDVDA